MFFAVAPGLGLLLATTSPVMAQTTDSDTPQKSVLHREEVVAIGHDVTLREGESAREIVVIGGSAAVSGTVDENVVVVGGDAQIDRDVGGNVVVVMGTVHLGPKAVLHHDLVVVGGKSEIADGAKVEGQTQEVNVGESLAPVLRLGWLKNWISNCALKFRPLSFNVGWIWWVAGAFFFLYLLIAVVFQHPVECCRNQLANRPATTFAVGIMAKLLLPVLCLILPFTIIGIFVVPFVVAGAILCLMVGKVALLEFIGAKVASPLGPKDKQIPLAAFCIGIVLLTALYLVPVLGLFTALVFSAWGFGAAATAAWVASRRENRPAPPPPATPSYSPPPSAPTGSMPFAMPLGAETTTATTSIAPPTSILYPRAGFWERMGAGFLDMALISVTTAIVGPVGILVAVAYFSGMWAWKGTTIGGIVLNLQVVKEDGRPLGFLTALVRSAAAVFSVLVLFLGFFWIGWDRQKQGWHDKIAGTVVVRLPKAIALVCL
jgi:uncharacterized RDD family membrane protein YckC